ncbi:MAG: hypothetical protein BWY71_02198 [Planctomycetes bacterium ADurb.Bin412]|nr:MAG: hypothetical protein BWY71_02198 [Planctomycetes bacterium ADurb.Bin412]
MWPGLPAPGELGRIILGIVDRSNTQPVDIPAVGTQLLMEPVILGKELGKLEAGLILAFGAVERVHIIPGEVPYVTGTAISPNQLPRMAIGPVHMGRDIRPDADMECHRYHRGWIRLGPTNERSPPVDIRYWPFIFAFPVVRPYRRIVIVRVFIPAVDERRIRVRFQQFRRLAVLDKPFAVDGTAAAGIGRYTQVMPVIPHTGNGTTGRRGILRAADPGSIFIDNDPLDGLDIESGVVYIAGRRRIGGVQADFGSINGNGRGSVPLNRTRGADIPIPRPHWSAYLRDILQAQGYLVNLCKRRSRTGLRGEYLYRNRAIGIIRIELVVILKRTTILTVRFGFPPYHNQSRVIRIAARLFVTGPYIQLIRH